MYSMSNPVNRSNPKRSSHPEYNPNSVADCSTSSSYHMHWHDDRTRSMRPSQRTSMRMSPMRWMPILAILCVCVATMIATIEASGAQSQHSTELAYVYPYTSTDASKLADVGAKVATFGAATIPDPTSPVGTPIPNPNVGEEKFSIQPNLRDRVFKAINIKPGQAYTLPKGATIYHATPGLFNTFNPKNGKKQDRGTWFSADWAEGVKLVMSNELQKPQPGAIYVRAVRVNRPLSLWTMYPTQHESLVALSRMGVQFDKLGVATPVKPLGPKDPDPVYTSYKDPHVFRWYGNNAESARTFIVALCDVLVKQSPPMYGWRNIYDQDEIMICPGIMQSHEGPPVEMAEGGFVCPATYNADISIGDTVRPYLLRQMTRNAEFRVKKNGLANKILERSTFFLNRAASLANPLTYEQLAADDDTFGRKYLVNLCQPNLRLKSEIANRMTPEQAAIEKGLLAEQVARAAAYKKAIADKLAAAGAQPARIVGGVRGKPAASRPARPTALQPTGTVTVPPRAQSATSATNAKPGNANRSGARPGVSRRPTAPTKPTVRIQQPPVKKKF